MEKESAYFPYLINENKNADTLMASCFNPLRLGIAPMERRKRPIALLTDNDYFNWETIPITSVAKTDKKFTVTIGAYQGNLSWSGSVWTLINETVIRGLIDCGETDLAAILIEKTLKVFRHNCAEFVDPFNGCGQGVLQYAWTASQYLELIVEGLFGIHYNAKEKKITVSPVLTASSQNSYLELKDLRITDKITLDTVIDHGKVSYSVSNN